MQAVGQDAAHGTLVGGQQAKAGAQHARAARHDWGRTRSSAATDRLHAADPAVRLQAERMLLGALGRPETTAQSRLGAVAGLGALLPAGVATCAAPCEALRALAEGLDERLAVAARLALGRAGDPSVEAELIADTTLGTEQLRVEAVDALAAGGHVSHKPAVQAALLARIGDESAVVQEAAVRALAPVADRPEVRKALATLRTGRSAHLRYAVDAVLAAGGR